MEQIYQSVVLQSLGWALADSLWQMALLWLACQLFIVLPFRQPHIRHAGAAVALFSGGLWFAANVVWKLSQAGSSSYSTGHVHPGLIAWVQVLLPYLSTAYLVILVILMARFAHAIVLTQRLRLAEETSSAFWQDVVDEMANRFFISRKVWIRITDAVSVPATIGFLKPVILLPLASVNNLSTTQVEAIIMHELAHIRRNDYLVNLVASFIGNILFFNPFAHLLVSQMRKDCELCCDDAVIRHRQDRGQYAQALLLLEKSKQRLPLAMAATGKESLLLGRIKRILQQPEQKVRYRHKLLALVLVAALIMGLSMLNPSGQHKTEAPLSRVVERQTQIMAKQTKTTAQAPAAKRRSTSTRPLSPVLPSIEDELGTDLVIEPDMVFAALPADPVSPLPPPPPPTVADRPAHPEVFREASPFVYFNAPDPRDLARNVEELANGRMMMEFDQHFEGARQAEEQMRRFNEFQRQFNMEMERVNMERNVRQQQMRIRTAVPPRAPKAPKAPRAVQPQVPSPEELLIKAIALADQRNIRAIQNGEGFTINIIEGERTIRISISDK